MAANTDLVTAKKNLSGALGDNMQIYLQLLKSWFKQKISREDFDHEARKLLTMDSVHLHNQFMLAILSKCQALGSSSTAKQTSTETSNVTTGLPHSPTKVSKKVKPKKRTHSNSPKVSFNQPFVAVNPLVVAPQIPTHVPQPEERGLGFASREMLLPDLPVIHMRLLVTSWEFGLDDIQDDLALLVMKAIQIQLKNILSAVFSRRSGYKMREKRFRYALGTELPDPSLRNSVFVEESYNDGESTYVSNKGHHIPAIRPTPETGIRNAATQLATLPDPKPETYRVTLLDLYRALQIHRSAIPSHTVYATNMERIVNRMWHPSNTDLDTEARHRKDTRHKQEVNLRQQLAPGSVIAAS